MELFRPAGLLQADPDSRDWTRDHGYAQVSSFPFPPLYLGDDLAQLAEEDPDLAPFLHQCLLQFVNHEYGHHAFFSALSSALAASSKMRL